MYSEQINFIPICFNTSIKYRVKPIPYYVLKHSICKKWAYTLLVVLLHKIPSKSCTWHLFIEFLQYFIWKIEEEKKTHQTLAFAFKRKLNVNKKSIAKIIFFSHKKAFLHYVSLKTRSDTNKFWNGLYLKSVLCYFWIDCYSKSWKLFTKITF